VANKHYVIRYDARENMHADVKAALLDYYGAYHVTTNPTGVAFLYDTSPYLIFTCTAIADKPIRLYVHGAAICRPFWSYGSGYTTGTNVDNPVTFSGTYETATAGLINVSDVHLVLGPHTLLMSCLGGTRLTSLLVLIGQLSNNDYVALAAMGTSSATYRAGVMAYNMTDAAQVWPIALTDKFQSAGGKLYSCPLILRNGAYVAEANGDGSPASFQDLANVSHVTSSTGAVWGTTYTLSHSRLYMEGGVTAVLPTCLLMEYEAEED
jgi:hypothetical protein